VTTTSLKLQDDLGACSAEAAKSRGIITTRAFILGAIRDAIAAAEQRADFVAAALAAPGETLQSGGGFDAPEAHDYLRASAPQALPAAAPYPTRPKIPRGACASSWRRSSGRRRSVVSWRQSNAQDSKVMVPLAGINQGIPSSKKTSFLSGCANHLFWRWDVTKALPRILLLVSGLICVSSSAVAGWFGPDNFKECLFEKMKGQSAQMLPLAADYCTREFPACWWNGKSYYSTCMKGKPLDAWNVSECVKYMNKKCEE